MNAPLVPFGKPRPERADAARNRLILLEAARAMLAEHGAEKVTMDALAERAGVGKGTVFRRFGSRAGIFNALLDDSEGRFQEQVLSGPPPLGPGAAPKQRLIAYGRARIAYLFVHHTLVRAALDRNRPAPMGEVSMTLPHFRMLLGRTDVPRRHLDGLALQLTSALEGPLMLYLSREEIARTPEPDAEDPLADSWQELVERVLPG
ncbi:helix-turn-helix domain-containing protein [Nocardiopsis sp. NPDC006198]|uniref:Helix-turn-helix domain containing protein n=1 Tax=Streptomonospora nanhaiensis TaxID=1323731 RepID=A0ABY6YVC7_9ACTN|nr:TetR/AcrR family transcriptional regulator [Streptomonospora nanhaiensis]WAE76240.1 helix-turn-helix domain containing protein [Streptomonospora nanhaiensis]